ncbi:MAG: cytochrome c oxidase subunit 3 [Gammaproteobacteria bacterium]|nr:cytochrome c oxidase subunit 3 [Gammaproteobacteria bacterium]
MSASTNTRAQPGSTVLWEKGDAAGHDMLGTRTFGFWLYMLTDAMVYAALFAAFGVLAHNAGLTSKSMLASVFDAQAAYRDTIVLFTSVLAYGYAMVALKKGSRGGVAIGTAVAMILGLVFLAMVGSDLERLFSQGIVPQLNGFLSIVFTLIIYHALHIIVGALWMLVMLMQMGRDGFTSNVVYRLINLRIFWHFQAVIWVLLFVFVYLQGKII